MACEVISIFDSDMTKEKFSFDMDSNRELLIRPIGTIDNEKKFNLDGYIIDILDLSNSTFNEDIKINNCINDDVKLDMIIFNKILDFPNLYQYETKTSQKVLMDKFPYVVIYEQYKDIIMILAIFHTSRNPINLQDRT